MTSLQNCILKHLDGEDFLTEPVTMSESTLYRGFSSNLDYNIGQEVSIRDIGHHFTYKKDVAHDFAHGSSTYHDQKPWLVILNDCVSGIDIKQVFNEHVSCSEQYDLYKNLADENEFYVLKNYNFVIMDIKQEEYLYPINIMFLKLKGDL